MRAIACTIALLASAATAPAVAQTADPNEVSAANLTEIAGTLASDQFEGRAPGTPAAGATAR